MEWDESADSLEFTDNARIKLGTGGDLNIYHNGTTSNIENVVGKLRLIQTENDGDISFESDDGSGGITAYLTLDGSAGHLTVQKEMQFVNGVQARFGTSNGAQVSHDSSSGWYFANAIGDIDIYNHADDGDISFYSDDGSGGTAEYFRLDGSSAGGGSLYTQFPDNSNLTFGSSDDLGIKHDGTDSKITNSVGDLVIRNLADDKDIILQSDDGSGGTTAYLTLDGSNTRTNIHKAFRLDDSIKGEFGTSGDLQIRHDSTNSEIINLTGNLTISNKADNKDIIFQCDDGSGGVETFFYLDGSATSVLQ